MSEFTERIDTAVAAWKAKLRRMQNPATDSSTSRAGGGATALWGVVTDLEADLATLLERVAQQQARVVSFQARAMKAIRANDDRAARHELLQQQQCVNALQELDAEITVLRAMLAECRTALDDTSAAQTPI